MSFEEIDLQWFAAEEEGRTEEPSEYKLRKAREEGRVAKKSGIEQRNRHAGYCYRADYCGSVFLEFV